MNTPVAIPCILCAQPREVPEQKPLVTIEDYLREYARLDSEETRLEEARKQEAAKRDAVEKQIVEKYNMEGMTSSKVAGLGTFSMSTMTRASIKEDQKEAAIRLMKEHFPDLVKETINSQTLSGFVGNSIKNDQDLPAALLATLNIFKKQTLSWRK